MRFFILFVFLLAILGFIFLESHTMEIKVTTEEEDDFVYTKTKVIWHWDRFKDYLTSRYKEIGKGAVKAKEHLKP